MVIVRYSLCMNSTQTVSIVFLGDVIGKPGRRAVKKYLASLDSKPDLIIANVENAAHGFGISADNLQELKDAGIQVFSGGNHTFDRKEIFSFIDTEPNLLRPANYPEGTPGKGWCIYESNGHKIALINVQGRVFMEPLRSPFLVAQELLEEISKQTNIILLDMHAEATAEKVAMGWYLDGKISVMLGTHTHVQTADERILPGGTAYITDIGCCGPMNGVIGMDKTGVFRRLIQQLPVKFEVAGGPAMVNGIRLLLNATTGKAVSIERIHFEEADEQP